MVVGPLEGPLALQASLLEEPEEELFLGGGELLPPPPLDHPGRREELLDRESRGDPPVEYRRERGHVLGEQPGGQNVHITPMAVPVFSIVASPVRV